MLDYDAVRRHVFAERRCAYTLRDTQLYALAVGMGLAPRDEAQLRHLRDEAPLTLPTMAAAIAWPGPWYGTEGLGIDAARIVHAEQRMRFFAPLPAAAALDVSTRIAAVHDRGAARGALVALDCELRDDTRRLASGRSLILLRGDGGFGAGDGRGDECPTVQPPLPGRSADDAIELPTSPQAALLYRLWGDRNALHCDPSRARDAGFDGPILHGLASYGIAGHALIRHACGGEPTRLLALGLRLSAPLYPGETLRFEFWRESAQRLRFRAHAGARCVIDRGDARIEA